MEFKSCLKSLYDAKRLHYIRLQLVLLRVVLQVRIITKTIHRFPNSRNELQLNLQLELLNISVRFTNQVHAALLQFSIDITFYRWLLKKEAEPFLRS